MGLLNRLIRLNKAEKDPLKTKESFTTLHNYEGRKQEHDALLREYGFPSEQDESAMRYQRFSEEDSDPDSPDGVTHTRPPWQVNEASEMAAEINDEDAPSFKGSDKAKNRAGENTASRESVTNLTTTLQPEENTTERERHRLFTLGH